MLFVGRIGREKRVLELLQSVTPVLRSRPGSRMIFAGDGPELNKLKDRLTALGLEKQVTCTGYVEWDSIGRIYRIADLFVTASLSEVHPMTTLEATLWGLPVVARKDDSYADTVHPGINGYLLDSDADFGEKVTELLDDSDQLKRFGEASRRIADGFSGRRHALCMEEFYQHILDRFANATPAGEAARSAK
jgi:1,2-diacylglycerol 3-alpha-glucosyltransferase